MKYLKVHTASSCIVFALFQFFSMSCFRWGDHTYSSSWRVYSLTPSLGVERGKTSHPITIGRPNNPGSRGAGGLRTESTVNWNPQQLLDVSGLSMRTRGLFTAMNWTEQVDPVSWRVHSSRASASRLHYVLIGYSKTRTICVQSVLNQSHSKVVVHTGVREL